MNNIEKTAIVIIIIALSIGLIYLQLEIQSSQSSALFPTPNPPQESVVADLNYTIGLDSGTNSDVILINGTISNNNPNITYSVGLLVTAVSNSSHPPYIHLGVVVPPISGSYNDKGERVSASSSSGNLSLTKLSPHQNVTVSITVYPTESKSLKDPHVRPVWTDKF
jgi:hypothetical protein